MTGPFRVYHDDIPLTVSIEDEKRAVRAYSMLKSITEDGYSDSAIEFRVNANEYIPIDTDALSVKDVNGNEVDIEPDNEWDYEFEDPDFDCNSFYEAAFTDNNDEQITFTSMTGNIDDATEIYNFLKYGIDPSVTIYAEHVNLSDVSNMIFRGQSVCFVAATVNSPLQVADFNDNVIEVPDIPDWTSTFMSDANQTFADAINAISESESVKETSL